MNNKPLLKVVVIMTGEHVEYLASYSTVRTTLSLNPVTTCT